jgi:hypothetical protein
MTAPADSGPGDTTSTSQDTGADQTGQTTTSTDTSTQDNPAWNPVWEKFQQHRTLNGFTPAIKETLTPFLKQWDQDRQNLTQQYAPWKQIIESGVPVEKTQYALQLFDLVDTNPQYVYEYLQNQLGLTPKEAEKVTKDAQNANAEQQDDSEDGVDPTIKALQQQMAELQSERQRTQYESMVSQNRAQLETGMNQLAEQHSKGQMSWLPFNPGAIAVFLKQQLFDAQQAGQPVKPDLKAAYDQWTAQAASIAGLQRNPAPRITPSSGGATGLPLNTDSGRIAPEVAGGRTSTFNTAAKEWIRNRASGS